MGAYAVFGAYAVLFAVFSAGEDQVWAIWASCGYAVALVILWRWPARTAAVLISVALAVQCQNRRESTPISTAGGTGSRPEKNRRAAQLSRIRQIQIHPVV